MSFIAMLIIAVGLSVDSMAAGISTGVCMKRISIFDGVKVAFVFAFFQGGLPILGWFAGNSFKDIIADYDHWVAFVLLLGIGAKMLYEGIGKNDDKGICSNNFLLLVGIGLATSIDALIVGVGIGLLGHSIWLPAVVIGATTFLLSLSGIYFGHHVGHRINLRLEMIGGVVLIGLGIKILVEHTVFL